MPETSLATQHCVPCEGGTPPLPADDISSLLDELDGGWQIEDGGHSDQLVKAFKFRDFVTAVDFVNRITPLAEAEGHHPDLFVAWGLVRVQLWTHAAGGLTRNDFVLAAKIDQL